MAAGGAVPAVARAAAGTAQSVEHAVFAEQLLRQQRASSALVMQEQIFAADGEERSAEFFSHMEGDDALWLKHAYEHHPEYALWRAHHVPLSQLEEWRRGGMDVLVLDAGLRWFAWHCAHRMAAGEEPDMAAEFAAWLARGGFPRPEGYVSYEEEMLSRREAVQREREERDAREDALRRREALSALRDTCAAMLERGEADETYRTLRDGLPPFIRQQEQGALRAVFERAMWEALRALAGLDAEEHAAPVPEGKG